MIAAGRGLLAAAAVVLAQPAPAPPPQVPPAARLFPAAAEAVAALAAGADAAGVVAFGEIHQDTGTAGVRSALARFTDEILPAIAPRTAHLIVETWVTRGTCGAAEAQVTRDVEKTTQRPAQTETEIVRLLRRAKESGIAPHILEIACDEYRSLTGAAGQVDYHRLLALTGRHLQRAIQQALLLPRPPGRPLVVVYGGALHNDLYPQPALAAYSFGPAIFAHAHGAYREIDLYVPELAEGLTATRAERWYTVWRHSAQPGQVTVIPRSARSAIVVFPRTPS